MDAFFKYGHRVKSMNEKKTKKNDMLFLNKIYIDLLKFGDVDLSEFSKIAKTG